MDEHEPINELCVVSLVFHPIKGVLMTYTSEDNCKLTDVCNVEIGDAWPETLQRSLNDRFGKFPYEILTLAKMETFIAKELWEAPRFGLFVICQVDEDLNLSDFPGKYKWHSKDDEIENDSYCHPLFKKIAEDVLKKHYSSQLQFSL